MWKAALAGALALATVGASSVCAQEQNTVGGEIRQATRSLITLTRNDIARLKSTLKLTPAQEQYWPAVDAALSQLAAEQAAEGASAGMLTRIRNRVVSVALTASAVQRLGYAAMPLLKSHDENQKRDATRFANSMGMGHLAAAF
jgi:hypothetical protein